jgi:thiol-disulfide isomerase/thioredoxin
MPWKIAALAGVLLALCAAALVFTMRDAGERSQPPAEVPDLSSLLPKVDERPPATGGPFFKAGSDSAPLPRDAFRDGSGNEVTLAAFAGRPVLLNFWATWCAPCVKELPSLARLKALLGEDGLQIVILNLDRAGGPSIPDFLAEHDAAVFEPYTDPAKKLMRAFRINGLPTTILIAADGTEIGRHEGEAEWDSPAARDEIDKALAGQ